MANLVTQTATLQCSYGASPCSFVVTNVTTTQGVNNSAANINSDTAYSEISGFSTCYSPSNPVISGSGGTISSTGCTPTFGSPWTPGSTTVQISSQGALTSTSTITCNYAAGTISITNAGEQTITVGS